MLSNKMLNSKVMRRVLISVKQGTVRSQVECTHQMPLQDAFMNKAA